MKEIEYEHEYEYRPPRRTEYEKTGNLRLPNEIPSPPNKGRSYSYSYSMKWYSYSYSMKWYSYSKDASETPPVNVPATDALRYFENDVRS